MVVLSRRCIGRVGTANRVTVTGVVTQSDSQAIVVAKIRLYGNYDMPGFNGSKTGIFASLLSLIPHTCIYKRLTTSLDRQ
jgi:hypothetical protein